MSKNKEIYDVIIIGGGIVGCSAAYYLAKYGIRSLVLESDTVAGHASGFALGSLNPLVGYGVPDLVLDYGLKSFQLHSSLSSDLLEETGIDTEYDVQPTINLAMTKDEAIDLQLQTKWQNKVKGFKSEWNSSEEMLKIEPRISSKIYGGSIIQGSVMLDPYKLTLGLLTSAEKKGAEIKYSEVIKVKSQSSGNIIITTKAETFNTNRVIFAMGPWTQFVSDWIGTKVPVEPLRGQIIKLKIDSPPINYISWSHRYISSKSDGMVWIGTTTEKVGFDERVTFEARNNMIEDVTSVFPYLQDAEMAGHTACLRPLSADGIPIIGYGIDNKNYVLATGGGKKGILYGPYLGKLAAQLTLGKTPTIDISPLRPDRNYSLNNDNKEVY